MDPLLNASDDEAQRQDAAATVKGPGSIAIFPFSGFDQGMGELAGALEALRSELSATRWAGEGGARLTVTLGLRAEWGEDGQCHWRLSEGVSAHVLTVDLSNVSDAGPAEAVDVAAELDQVFGAPGFDSAARATVFRERAQELGVPALRDVLILLEAGKVSEDAALDRARHAIERLLERGPAGVRDGARRLVRLFARQDAVTLLDVIGSRWRYGTGHGPA